MAERFKSRKSFILTSVGAAVGLGNALRFPGLCAKYGGGAFIAVYLFALLALGIPLLNAEIALGRKLRRGAPACMQSLARGGYRLGRAQCANSLLTALIYAGIAAWIVSEALAIIPLSLSGSGAKEAGEYFFKSVLKSSSDGVISGISPTLCLCLAGVWAALWLCLRGGAGSLSAAAKFTVFAPVIMLAVICARGLAFENSGVALRALFLPSAAGFSSPEMWINALGQVFFSLSLAVGIMPAYGAYLPEKCGIFPASLVIAAADAAVSVLASVALFTTLYGCGLQNKISPSGIITAFNVYPAAIVTLFKSRALCAVFGFLFYACLSMMAVQSGASMLEAALSPLVENSGLKRGKIAGTCCVFGFFASLIFATTAGDKAVETGDLFVNFYNVLVLCVLECLILGWGKGGAGLEAEINAYCKKLKIYPPLYKISVKFLCPITLAALAVPAFSGLKLLLGPAWLTFAFGYGASLTVFLSAVITFGEGVFGRRQKQATTPRK